MAKVVEETGIIEITEGRVEVEDVKETVMTTRWEQKQREQKELG